MQKLQVPTVESVLDFKRVKKGEGDEEGWEICVRIDDEKRLILESCHERTNVKANAKLHHVEVHV